MTTTKLLGKTPILIAFVLLASALQVAAATLTVTNAKDSGAGSLRAAIETANSNAQEDTINFDPTFFNVARTITLTSGEILITPDDQHFNGQTGRLVTINGPGANLLTISGGNASRIFLLAGNPGQEQQNANVTMSGMTLRDGNGVGAINGDGGAIFAQLAANLTLNSMVIRNNVITAAAIGGGMYFNGVKSVAINDSLITENSAYHVGGFATYLEVDKLTMRNTIVSNNRAISGNVGGISIYRGTNVITNCQIIGNNSKGPYGGIDFFQAEVDMSDTIISGNVAGATGAGTVGGINTNGGAVVTFRRVTVSNNFGAFGPGGIQIRNPSGIVTIIDSTVSNNSADGIPENRQGAGGGISVSDAGTQSGQITRIINSTISGNSAAEKGGGIYNFSNGLELINSTVVNNSAGGSNFVLNGGGGIYDGEIQRSGEFGFRVKLQNSIIAGNTASSSNGPDLYSGFDSAGYNIVGNTAGTNNSRATTGDQFNVDPKVGPLANNGGPTKTHALLKGSPAIDKGKSPQVKTDQRGVVRPTDNPSIANAARGDGSDIGAYEVGASNGVAGNTLGNIATRLPVLGGDKVLIGGIIVVGDVSKRVIIRGLGPSLAGVTGVLEDPTLELYEGNTLLASNNNWKDTQASVIAGTGVPPANNAEAAIVRILAPGAYTAVMRGNNGTTGVGLLDAYDLDPRPNSKLGNISSRGFVGGGDNVLIGGFIAGPTTRVAVRAIGPSLSKSGVAGALQNPVLEVVNSNGDVIGSNDNWRGTQQAEIKSIGIQPGDEREAVVIATLISGAYTAVVRGVNGTTGIGLVEIYNLR